MRLKEKTRQAIGPEKKTVLGYEFFMKVLTKRFDRAAPNCYLLGRRNGRYINKGFDEIYEMAPIPILIKTSIHYSLT